MNQALYAHMNNKRKKKKKKEKKKGLCTRSRILKRSWHFDSDISDIQWKLWNKIIFKLFLLKLP
jgi:hypothetical protein